MSSRFPNVVFSSIDKGTKGESDSRGVAGECGRRWSLQEGVTMEEYALLYLGPESPTLTHFLMKYNQSQVSSNPDHDGRNRFTFYA